METLSFMVCGECLIYIANGNLTGLDYNPETADERMEAILAGEQYLQERHGGHLCAGDSDKDDEHSIWPCECCGDTSHGSRHEAVLLVPAGKPGTTTEGSTVPSPETWAGPRFFLL